MSLHPDKKSDLGKSWMRPRRNKPKKIQPEYHLIVTEGTNTEPEYFGAMAKKINRAYSDRIQFLVCGAGDNTRGLFQKAKDLVTSSANGYKHVWIVYDTDDFPQEHINQTAELCKSESTEETTYVHRCGFQLPVHHQGSHHPYRVHYRHEEILREEIRRGKDS